MRYGELVQFEPIESVVQLATAGEAARARQLVETYVVSDRMADQLANVVIPQLQFLRPRDNKGVLIVGNYGTGKSHLMSVLAAIAEFPDLAEQVGHEAVREAAAGIAGRFKVARVELGSVTGSLRDILLGELESALEEWGTPFRFPPASELTNNKDVIVEAVGAFRKQYPEHGILLAVDELLDYLRAREERQIILDLGFLRELGEVAALTPFRFVGGLQETLFDSPRFEWVADPLRRVRDRFEQVSIARQDIAYVVANRLLRKTDEQLAWITEHLRQFTPLYGTMAERLGDFARLFPIHPSYIDVFQALEGAFGAEKREVLKTFSEAMRGVLDEEVPEDQPGLLAYDHYWSVMRSNPSMRTYPAVGEVLEKGAILEGRIEHAYSRRQLKPMALRIVHGLGVHRLTTGDLHAPIGATPEELRDNLCLYVRTPEASAEFLMNQVRVALREIARTVSGQYLSYNDANDQYYLDVKKDIDFDAKIRERGDTLGDDELNRYFFSALQQVLGLATSTYVTGHRIWPYELPWDARKAMRPGYLFFGAPDERSTAQPPRDFYVYLLPPFIDRSWHDERLPDEVAFSLTGLDDEFKALVRQYAGARALANESSSHRDVYAQAAEEHLKRLLRWLNERLARHLEATYQGATRSASAWLPQAKSTASQGIEDLIRILASALLAPHFEEQYPEYPTFGKLGQPVSETARASNATAAIQTIAGRGRTNLTTAILDGLELLGEDGMVRPERSRYAQRFLAALAAKPEGQVVNRGELIAVVAGGIDRPVEKDIHFGLEPEWVAVVLTAMVYAGQIALTTDNREQLDASTVDRAATIALGSIERFLHYAQPKQVPVNVWVEIFEGLGLQAALIRDERTREEAVRNLLAVIQREQTRVADLSGRLGSGLKLGVTPVFTDQPTFESEKGAIVGSDVEGRGFSSTSFQAALRGYKSFLEELAKFNTVGKLRNLRLGHYEVHEALGHRSTVERAESLTRLVGQLQPVAAYLAVAQANLPRDHEWTTRAVTAQAMVLEDVRRMGSGEASSAGSAGMQRELGGLRQEYVALYAKLHAGAVLGPRGDERRQRLYDDDRFKALTTLAGIDLLNKSDLEGWKIAIRNIPVCKEFHEGAIDQVPTCPFCGFRPVERPSTLAAEQLLSTLDERLESLLVNWRLALSANLGSEAAQQSIESMTPAEREPIAAFLKQEESDPVIPAGFVKAAIAATHGITTVTLDLDDLRTALSAGGLPCTVDDLTTRFSQFVKEAMRGHDKGNTRLTLARTKEVAEVIDLTEYARPERAAL